MKKMLENLSFRKENVCKITIFPSFIRNSKKVDVNTNKPRLSRSNPFTKLIFFPKIVVRFRKFHFSPKTGIEMCRGRS